MRQLEYSDFDRSCVNLWREIGILESFLKLDLLLIPGLAFTNIGKRIGRGKGAYDRLLTQANANHKTSIGICFSNQMVEDIPTEKHDQNVSHVLSENLTHFWGW